MRNTPALETERLALRRFSIDDAEAFFEIMNNKEVNKHLPLFPIESIEEAKSHLTRNYLDSYEKPFGCRYAVCLRCTDTPVGYVNVSDDDSHDLGYGLRRDFWHNGITTEACKAVVGRLKRVGIPYITATHDIDNPRSGEVMKKIGMTYRYSYQELWQPKNKVVAFRMYQLNLDGHDKRVYRKYWRKYPIHYVEDGV